MMNTDQSIDLGFDFCINTVKSNGKLIPCVSLSWGTITCTFGYYDVVFHAT